MDHDLLVKGQLKNLLPFLTRPNQASSTCRIRANNDIEALERWLDEYFDKPATFRSYKKEGGRFLVWCVLARQTNLANLDRDDVETYLKFLRNPEPKETWCGPKGGRKSDNKIWRPFTGPLSDSAIKTAAAILHSLMSYLQTAGYIEFNPFVLVRRKAKVKDQLQSNQFAIDERILDDREWQAILLSLEEQDQSTETERTKKERLTFLLTILYFLGLRIDELARATWANFRKQNNKWWFFVRGKGDRLGKIPVNSQLLQAIIKFRHSQGLAPLPIEHENRPIISSLSQPDQGLSTRQMSNLLKGLAREAAQKFGNDPQVMKKLLRFSPHWLRHLSASRQDLAGIAFTNIKQNLRHQNEQTTRLYVHAHDDQRHLEMEKLSF